MLTHVAMNRHPIYRDLTPQDLHFIGEVGKCLARWRRPRFVNWLERVESVLSATGGRCELVHVSRPEWAQLFAAGLTPEDAVLVRLVRVQD